MADSATATKKKTDPKGKQIYRKDVALSADTLARIILEERLAACVQIVSCASHYHWQEKIEHAAECKLLIKTISSLYPQLERFILKNHPYQVPEILAVAVVNCNQDYYAWLKAEVKGHE